MSRRHWLIIERIVFTVILGVALNVLVLKWMLLLSFVFIPNVQFVC